MYVCVCVLEGGGGVGGENRTEQVCTTMSSLMVLVYTECMAPADRT